MIVNCKLCIKDIRCQICKKKNYNATYRFRQKCNTDIAWKKFFQYVNKQYYICYSRKKVNVKIVKNYHQNIALIIWFLLFYF